VEIRRPLNGRRQRRIRQREEAGNDEDREPFHGIALDNPLRRGQRDVGERLCITDFHLVAACVMFPFLVS
jgi:hypothetical protein